MHTIFLLHKSKNTSLFPLVMRAFRTEDNSFGVIHYRGLNWRMMSHEELAVEIYGELVGDLPDPLKYASYELYLYDFREDGPLTAGRYRFRTAQAEVVRQSPTSKLIYEVAIQGSMLHDLNELYRLILTGGLTPFQT